MRIWILAAVSLGVGVAAGVGTAYVRVATTASDPAAMLSGARQTGQAAMPGAPRAKVAIDETDFNFGLMKDDATLSHAFWFRNEGDDTLTLTKGSTTCRCTMIDLEETKVPPGGKAAVTLQWNSKNQAGPYRQSATVFTNDPDRPEVTLTVSGQVAAALRVTPTDLVFGGMTVGESATGSVKILSYVPDGLQVTGYELEDQGLADKFEVAFHSLSSDELKDEPGVRGGSVVKVTVKSGLPLGGFRQKITLRTNLKDNPQIEIPVEGTVVSDISIVGPGWNEKNGVLTLGTFSSREGNERTLRLACRGPLSKQVRYKVARVEPGLLQVELGNPTEANQGKVSLTPMSVRVPKGTQPVNYLGGDQGELGQITIETNHPQAPQLRILVRFAVEG